MLWFVIFVTAIVCKWKAPSLLAPANLVTGALGFNVVTFIVLPALFHPLLYKVAALGLSIALLSSATGFVGSLIQNNRIWKPLFVGCILVGWTVVRVLSRHIARADRQMDRQIGITLSRATTLTILNSRR